MKTTLKFLLPAIIIIGAAFWLIMPSQAQLPAQSFDTIDGKPMQLQDYAGQPLLVIFWSTDCPSCIAEMPELIELHEQYATAGLNMLGIAMPHDTTEQIKAMRQAKELPYTLTWDEDSALSKAFGNIWVTPTHFLVDAEGNIVMRKIGDLNFQSLQQKLNKMGLSPA